MLPLPTIRDLSSLIKALKPSIRDDYRAYADEPGLDDENIPSMQLTIGWNPENGSWDYQTGDNSYSGSAYFYPFGVSLPCIVVVTPLPFPATSAPNWPTWPANNPPMLPGMAITNR